MSRARSLTVSVLSAATAAAITAAAFLAFAGQPEAAPDDGVTEIRSEQPMTVAKTPLPEAPTTPPTFSELTRPTVDWATIYANTVPSLVSVVTDAGGGSGFFVSEDGHVVTNHHVVAGGDDVRIYTQQGERVEAEILARDVGNDLALLKVDPDGLEIVVPAFGEIDEIHVGDPVGALGAPFGLPNTLTVGIVSALDRTRRSGPQTWEPLRAMIQTDAALNPGNSGGMLIDEGGRVIGIPTQIESSFRSSSGIGFAVSVEALTRSLPTMLEGRDVERTFLGVSLNRTGRPLTIVDVYCETAADDAELRDGDRLLSINGQSANTYEELADLLAAIQPGDDMTITVQRGLRRVEVEATAKAWPSTHPEAGCG